MREVFPWKEELVRVTAGGPHRDQVGMVKRVWPDGHGSLALLLYLPQNDSSLEVDYFDVVELK